MATARRTRSQERVFQCLKSLEQEISAQNLLIELRERKQRMGLATVYRALEALKLEGVVQVRTLASGKSLYSSQKEDRHHITCLQCGESLLLDFCPVHALEQELNESYQFKAYYHTLEFYGLCNQCQTGSERPKETHTLPRLCTTDDCTSCNTTSDNMRNIHHITTPADVQLSDALDS